MKKPVICLFLLTVDQGVKPVGMFCNLIESIEVECLSSDYLLLQSIVTAQNLVITL